MIKDFHIVGIDGVTPKEWDDMHYLALKYNSKDPENYDAEVAERESLDVMFKEALVDMDTVVEFGGNKHGYGSWKESPNPSLQRKANHASMSRHLAEGYMGEVADKDTGVHPYLHLAVRAMMEYTRWKRGIKDDDDTK